MKRALFLVPLALFLGLAVYFAVGLTKDPAYPAVRADRQTGTGIRA